MLESYFCKRKEKKREVGGVGGDVLWDENINVLFRVYIYKLIENINIIVFGIKLKYEEELNLDIVCVIYIFFNKISYFLKMNKGLFK